MMFLWLILIFLLIVAMIFDVCKRRVPNSLSVFGIVVALTGAVAFGGLTEFIDHFFGGIIMGAVGFVAWNGGLIGGGDQKLVMMVGAFVGRGLTLPTLFFIAVVGGIQALVICYRHKRNKRVDHAHSWSYVFHTTTIPYTIAIASGTVITLVLYSQRLLAFWFAG